MMKNNMTQLKKRRKLKKSAKFLIIGIIVLILLMVFIYLITPASMKYKKVSITIEPNTSTVEIAKLLKNNKIIKSKTVFVLYSKLNKVEYYAASYYLSPDMTLKEITKELQTQGYNKNEVAITIKEGMNIRVIAKEISKNTSNSYEDVLNKLKDTKYLDSLIEKYWFITKDIKNNKVYYSLEGYLYPDTYYFDKEKSTTEEILNTMIEQMNKKLTKYKSQANKSNYSIHELLTLASITQSEGYNEADFRNIASVFYNRMESKIALGSCVTSYYGVKKDMTQELTNSDINNQNSYNTRGTNPVLFPAGPISSPGEKALNAVLKPITTNYYYFVSDKNHKLYFTKTLNEHEKMISKLEKEGLWLEW